MIYKMITIYESQKWYGLFSYTSNEIFIIKYNFLSTIDFGIRYRCNFLKSIKLYFASFKLEINHSQFKSTAVSMETYLNLT